MRNRRLALIVFSAIVIAVAGCGGGNADTSAGVDKAFLQTQISLKPDAQVPGAFFDTTCNNAGTDQYQLRCIPTATDAEGGPDMTITST